MFAIRILLLSLVGATLLLYQNCGRVKFDVQAEGGTKVPTDCTAGGANGTAICAAKTVYFIGGVAQVFGNSTNADDGSGEIILSHPFNGKNARVKILMNQNGEIEVQPAEGYYPWACVDHTQPIDVKLVHTNKDGTPGMVDSNCYSPIRWYTEDGQQGFAKDVSGTANDIQKSSTGEVYRRANPDESGVYVTNMVLAPIEKLNKNLIWVKNPTPRSDFMMYFTTLYSGVFPFPADATHLKVYDYKYNPNMGSEWTDLLIENNPQQLGQAAAEGYTP